MDHETLEKFILRLKNSLQDNGFVRLRLRPTDRSDWQVRLVDLKAGPSLSFARHTDRQTTTVNHAPPQGVEEVARLLAGGGTAWLETRTKNWQLVAPAQGRARLVAHQAQVVPGEVPRSHDRIKKKQVTQGGDWLCALGLTDERGQPKPGRADKLRQIERYADLLSHLAADCGWKAGAELTVVDMGCGKGYLTFAAWRLLREKLGLAADVIGVDAQPALIEACAAIARQLGATGLSFRTGTIAETELPNPDVLIALHACNDATDHALRRGIEAGAKLIVVAPCCHKDVRRLLGAPDPIAPLLAHGLFKERFAEWLTDGLRTLALEAAGYRVRVAEFVDAEHTPKNVLLGAVRGLGTARRTAAADEYAALKAWAGLGTLPLDPVDAQRSA